MKVGELAIELGGVLEGGDEAQSVTGVGSLAEAQPGEISFLSNPRYNRQLAETRALAVLVRRDWSGEHSTALIRVDNPDRAFADAVMLLAPPPRSFEPGVDPTAVIHPSAQLGEDVHIGPHCVVESGAVIGARSVLVAGCYIGERVIIGADCCLQALVSVREHCRLGARVRLHNGVVIGCDGFGYTQAADGSWQKIEQVGTVEIDDDVEIGANTTIDRARFGKTRIGRGVKIDNLVQVAHNVQVGEHSVMAAQVGISGSTRIGRGVQIGGQAGLAGHLTVGDGAVIGAQAGVTKSVEAGMFVSGYPAMEHRQAARLQAHLANVPVLRDRVRALERTLSSGEDRKR